MDFASLLRKTNQAAVDDKAAFEKWQNRESTIDECIASFRFNNRVPEGTPIEQFEFIRWIEGLGYRRR